MASYDTEQRVKIIEFFFENEKEFRNKLSRDNKKVYIDLYHSHWHRIYWKCAVKTHIFTYLIYI